MEEVAVAPRPRRLRSQPQPREGEAVQPCMRSVEGRDGLARHAVLKGHVNIRTTGIPNACNLNDVYQVAYLKPRAAQDFLLDEDI